MTTTTTTATTTATLFDPIQVGDLALSNRIVMAPLTRNRSPQGIPSDLTATYYAQRASAGLIVSEGVPISQQGQGYADVPGLYRPEQVQAWQRVTQAVHAQGGKIVAQLWHVGRISHTSLQPGGAAPVAPSALTAQTKTYLVDPHSGQGGFFDTSAPRALSGEEIPALIQDYADAAHAAIRAGFDGVEIHAANGYLLDQFLRDSTNQRSDAWGGSVAQRARLLVQVLQAVSGAIGSGKVGVRLSPVTPSNDIRDSQPQALFEHVARELAPLGLAFIHVVEGATGGPREVPGSPFDYAAFKAAYRAAGGRGAWMVNNGYTRATALQAVASAQAELVSFGRAFIANPDLVQRLRQEAPLNEVQRETLYGGGAQGYTDYPTL